MTYYRVVSASDAWIDRFETEGEALICADRNPGSRVEEFEGPMPEKLTPERVREIMEDLQRDTPENRARAQIIDDFFAKHPAIQSLKDQYGDK